MSTALQRGADWAIWDLHVHTPASVVSGYGKDEGAWDRYLDDLERLPSDIKVLGINDYWFLDGYKRVSAAKAAGRLPNIELLLPVVEMRIEQFGGSNNHLKRVNLHVIFDPKIGIETIESQFLNRLGGSFQLAPEADGATWAGAVTRQSLEDLGRQVKDSVPEDRLNEYQDDFVEGFNNLNVPMSEVEKLLQSSYLSGHTLLGIGKAEWSQIKWNDQSVASKKSIINKADLVFTAFQDATTWAYEVENLKQNKITHQLLDCSDAHYPSTSDQDLKVGACQSWLNTTFSFQGLAHALKEFDTRVHVGLEPAGLARVRTAPESVLDEVKLTSSDKETYSLFDYSLPLNTGFIAIVGNKGQGKSALLDCIALAGNSSRYDEFAFLNRTRFLRGNNKEAKEYSVRVSWRSGKTSESNLTHTPSATSDVAVEYLPQRFVERVCAATPLSDDAALFERELREILFTHIDEEERAQEHSFEALLALKTQASRGTLAREQAALKDLIASYASAATFAATQKAADVEARLASKREDLRRAEEDLEKAKAALASTAQSAEGATESEQLEADLARLRDDRSVIAQRRSEADRGLAQLRQAAEQIRTLETQLQTLREDAATTNTLADQIASLVSTDGPFDPIVSVSVNQSAIDRFKQLRESRHGERMSQQSTSATDGAAVDAQIAATSQRLAAIDGERALARQRVSQTEERIAQLKGSDENPDSIAGLVALLTRIQNAPVALSAARSALLNQAGTVYEAIQGQLEAVESLYRPATEFIAGSSLAGSAGLEFDASIRFTNQWLGLTKALDGRKSGDLIGWIEQVPDRIGDTSWESIEAALRDFLTRLESERGTLDGELRDPASALRTSASLDGLLREVLGLDWLEVRFGLTGDGMPLELLSPGQRGLILALFYLVVDRRTIPLLLDQPEENLDNETIATRLVPAIHDAAARRQTIVVTHNANLAVVGDADQIVHCVSQDRKFTVSSGHISELGVASLAVNVLEGTKPAFDNRRAKYGLFPNLT